MRALLYLIVLCQFEVALAGLPGLESAYSRLLARTRTEIVSQTQPSGSSSCTQKIANIAADGQINIFVAFGYMDVSGGQDFNDSGPDLYGNGDVLDIDAANALAKALQSSCVGANNKACGFSKRGGRFSKRIRNRFSGKNINVNVTLMASAQTADDQTNKTSQNRNQISKSNTTRSHFLSALQTHDVVIYMGHARSGGGPDFFPPVLKSNGHVNYTHYKSEQYGIRSMLAALKAAPTPPSMIGVLACKSTGLFASRIRKVASSSYLVTADDLFDYNDILPTGYAMIDAVVAQKCGANLANTIKIRPASSSFLSLFQ